VSHGQHAQPSNLLRAVEHHWREAAGHLGVETNLDTAGPGEEGDNAGGGGRRGGRGGQRQKEAVSDCCNMQAGPTCGASALINATRLLSPYRHPHAGTHYCPATAALSRADAPSPCPSSVAHPHHVECWSYALVSNPSPSHCPPDPPDPPLHVCIGFPHLTPRLNHPSPCISPSTRATLHPPHRVCILFSHLTSRSSSSCVCTTASL
jgi:hypothetical protein